MYFTALPDHSAPGFDEKAHFSRFRQHNVIFNAFSPESRCDHHVGCLSLKTILSGEEWYTIDGRHMAIRPGQFLILNDDQPYGCRILRGLTGPGRPTIPGAHVLSIFFQKEFAASVLDDMLRSEDQLLDDPSHQSDKIPGFFQTLHAVQPNLARDLSTLITQLDIFGDDPNRIDEALTFLLRHLIRTHRSDQQLLCRVDALKITTRQEVYKRLCIAKDILHSSYHEPLDLSTLGARSYLSRPQLIRQFKAVFGRTPYQYLLDIRLHHAAAFLKGTSCNIREITWRSGFNDPSAFCRAFRSAYGLSPEQYRAHHR